MSFGIGDRAQEPASRTVAGEDLCAVGELFLSHTTLEVVVPLGDVSLRVGQLDQLPAGAPLVEDLAVERVRLAGQVPVGVPAILGNAAQPVPKAHSIELVIGDLLISPVGKGCARQPVEIIISIAKLISPLSFCSDASFLVVGKADPDRWFLQAADRWLPGTPGHYR